MAEMDPDEILEWHNKGQMDASEGRTEMLGGPSQRFFESDEHYEPVSPHTGPGERIITTRINRPGRKIEALSLCGVAKVTQKAERDTKVS